MSITIGGDHAPDPIASRLFELGYEPTRTSHERSSDGATASTWACRAWHVLLAPDGSRADYAPHRNLAVLSLRYFSDRSFDSFSPLAQLLADTLVEAFAPSKPRMFKKREAPPLVRRTPKSVEIVWRGEFSAELRDLARHHRPTLYPHGLCTRDRGAPLALVAGFPDIPVGDDATWLADRSPLTVARDALPEWNSDAVSGIVAELVDKHVTAGDLTISDGYQEPRRPDGYWSVEAQLARQGVNIAPAVDAHTGRVSENLTTERGHFG